MTQSEEIALKSLCKIKAPLIYKFINSEATELNPSGNCGDYPKIFNPLLFTLFLTPVELALKSNFTLLKFSDKNVPLLPVCFSVNSQIYIFPLRKIRG